MWLFHKPTDVPMFLQDEVSCVGAAVTARSRRNKELIFLPWAANDWEVWDLLYRLFSKPTLQGVPASE